MSLDWSIDRVKDYKNRCWVPAEKKGRVKLADDTDFLVWATMVVDLGSITKTNWPEWAFRLQVLKQCRYPLSHEYSKEGGTLEYWVTIQQIKDHIGMGTNVTTLPRGKWLRKILKRIENDAQDIINQKQNGDDK